MHKSVYISQFPYGVNLFGQSIWGSLDLLTRLLSCGTVQVERSGHELTGPLDQRRNQLVAAPDKSRQLTMRRVDRDNPFRHLIRRCDEIGSHTRKTPGGCRVGRGTGGDRVAAYDVIGDGEPALLFPGGPGAAGSYMRKYGELSSDIFTNYLIDPHGSGRSTPPASPDQYSPEGHARFYDDVREALGLERVTVLGHSFGGGVALAYAALFPDATSRCICAAGFAIGADVDAAEGGKAAAEMEAMLSRHRLAEWYADARATWESCTERVLAAGDGSEVDQMMRTVLPLYAAHPERPDVWAASRSFAAT